MNCRVCNAESKYIFTAKILNKYNVGYFHCEKCGFLETEDPYWLDESYKSSINISDTGLVQRNIELSRKVAILLNFFFGKNLNYLDYAGGYGLFTRLMRDIGFNFYHNDPFTENLFARGLEYNPNDKYQAITTFETFEHFVNPLEEIEKMIKFSPNIIFTTELLPPTPPQEWWYYGLEHGQHVSFYSKRTLEKIAKKFQLEFCSNYRIHLFSKKKINYHYYSYLLKLERLGLFKFVRNRLHSKTQSDSDSFKLD